MKKIFTLVAMTLIGGGCAWAQEVFDVSTTEAEALINAAIANPVDNSNPNFIEVPQDEKIFPENTQAENLESVTGGHVIALKEYVWTASTENITLKAVSTPNADASANESWQIVSNNTNMQLTTEECSPKFTKAYKGKNGNPSIGYKDFYEYNKDGEPVHRVSDVYWTVGCGQLPAKGLYYEFTANATGTLKVGVYIHRISGVSTFVVDKSTMAPLPVSALKLEGFMNNNTWDGFEGKIYHEFVINENYQIEGGGQNRAVFGYLSFPVEAGKSYMVFNDKQQMGLYGYEFTGTSGIVSVTSGEEVNSDAPVYNLAGQRVNENVKGILIQNGKKFIRK